MVTMLVDALAPDECRIQVATREEVFLFDLPAVGEMAGFEACMSAFLPGARPLKLGVGVAEDLKLLARCRCHPPS